jgi:hypothetical protein
MYWSGAALPLVIVAILLAAIPASDLALSILNFDITNLFKPHLLPRMDTAVGVPDTARTMVVVPVIFSSVEAVAKLVEKLEVLFLANEDEQIYFALIGDFSDAPAAQIPGDDALLESALGPERLNARYSKDETRRFHLFHRRRQWNPRRTSGWAGSASAASCTNSTGCCAAPAIPALSRRLLIRLCSPACAMWLHLTPTLNCRVTRRVN